MEETVKVVLKLQQTHPLYPEEPYEIQTRSIVESILDHYFSPYKSSYNLEDIKCFLKLANIKAHWSNNMSVTHENGDILVSCIIFVCLFVLNWCCNSI